MADVVDAPNAPAANATTIPSEGGFSTIEHWAAVEEQTPAQYLGVTDADVAALAESGGMSKEAALKTIVEYKKNPKAPEFQTMRPEDRALLAKAATHQLPAPIIKTPEVKPTIIKIPEGATPGPLSAPTVGPGGVIEPGKPQYYEKDGERYYAEGSVPYSQGIFTESQRIATEGGRASIVGFVNAQGQAVTLPITTAQQLQSLRGLRKIQAMQKLGLLPADAHFHVNNDLSWDQMSADDWKKLSREDQELFKTRGLRAVQLKLEQEQSNQLEATRAIGNKSVPDFLAAHDYSLAARQTLITAGYKKEDVNAIASMMVRMTKAGAADPLKPTYQNIIDAVTARLVSERDIDDFYGEGTIDEVSKWHASVQQVKEFEQKTGMTVAQAKQSYDEWQRKLESGELIAVGNDEYMTRENFNALPGAATRRYVAEHGVTALTGLETSLAKYRVGDSYNLDKVVYDNNPALITSARVLFGDKPVDDAIRRVRPTGAWWYRDPIAGMRVVSDEERSKILSSSPDSYYDRFTRTSAGVEAGLTRTTMKLADWSVSETKPVNVAELDRIAAEGTGPEKIQLGQAMHAAGFTFPSGSAAVDFKNLSSEDKQKVVASWGAPGVIAETTTKVQEWTSQKLADLYTKAAENPRLDQRFIETAGIGLLNIVNAVLVAIPTTILSAVEGVVSGKPKTAAVTLSGIPLGMAHWAAVDAEKRIRDNPVAGVGVLAGELFGPKVAGKVIGGIAQTGKELINIRSSLRPTEMGYNPDIPASDLPPGMGRENVQAMIQAAAEAIRLNRVRDLPGDLAMMGLYKAFEAAVRDLPRDQRVSVEFWLDRNLRAIDAQAGVIIRDAVSGSHVTMYETAWNRFYPEAQTHMTGDITPLENQLKANGYIIVRATGKDKFMYSTPALHEVRVTSGLPEGQTVPTNPGGLIIMAVEKDYHSLPADLLRNNLDPGIPFDAIRDEISRRVELPAGDPLHLPEGIYPVLKFAYGAKFIELEYVITNGFRLNALPYTNAAKDLGTGTATLEMPSRIAIDGTRLPNYKLMVVATDAALQAGASAPTVADMVKMYAYDKTLGVIQRLLTPHEARPMTYAKAGVTTLQRTRYKPLEVSTPRVISSHVVAKELMSEISRTPPERFTNVELEAWGDRFDPSGKYIVNPRDPIRHPEAPAKEGLMRSRVTLILRDKATGDVIVMHDRSDLAGTNNVGGGQIDPQGTPRVAERIERLSGKPKAEWNVSPEEAAREQNISELGVDLENMRRMPTYWGMATEHAFPGSAVYEAWVDFNRLNPKVSGGEIQSVSRLKSGGSDVLITPATKELLSALRDFDVSKFPVREEGWTQLYRDWRDPGYADRVRDLNPKPRPRRPGEPEPKPEPEPEARAKLLKYIDEEAAKIARSRNQAIGADELLSRSMKELWETDIIPYLASIGIEIPIGVGISAPEATVTTTVERMLLEPLPEAPPPGLVAPEHIVKEIPPRVPKEIVSEISTVKQEVVPRVVTETPPGEPGLGKEFVPGETPPPRVPPETPVVPPGETPTEFPPTTPPETPLTPTKTPPAPIPGGKTTEEWREYFRNSYGWPQGFGYWAIKPDTKEKRFFYGQPPPGWKNVKEGPGEAYRGIQALEGVGVGQQVLKMGFQQVTISSPTSEPGRPGAISFRAIRKGEAINEDIDLKYRPSHPEMEHGLKFGSTFEEALGFIPRDWAQQGFVGQRIVEMLSEMSPKEIASKLQAAGYGIDDEKTQFILQHMPDMARKELETRLIATREEIKLGPEQRKVTRVMLSRKAVEAEQAAELGTARAKSVKTRKTTTTTTPTTPTPELTKMAPRVSTTQSIIGDVTEWV